MVNEKHPVSGINQMTQTLQIGERQSTYEADGHRWFWKNERERKWVEFHHSNNENLERKMFKEKLFAHILVDRKWQQVTFASMKMILINHLDETEVKRSVSKPVYKGFGGSDIDSEKCDEGGSSPIKKSVTLPACQDDEQTYVDTSDDDRDKSKPMKRNKKNNREKDTMQPLRNHDDKQCHDYAGERKFDQQLLRKGGDDISDPEADFSPSDEDDDESKHGRRNKKKDGEKDKGHKNGRHKDDKYDKRTGKRKLAHQRVKVNGYKRSDPDEDYSQYEHERKKWKPNRTIRKNEDKRKKQVSGKQSRYISENQQMQDSKLPGERKYFLSDASAIHFEAHHGGFHFLHTFAQLNTDSVRPLHIAASLGLKRNVSYLLQAGWDLNEEDQHGATPIQKAQNKKLVEYMKTFLPEETNPVELQPQADDTYDECMVLPITMDRVDLSTRQVYLPSFQFRKTFEKGKHKPLLFTSPYVTTYEVVCQHQVYGVLWLLGQYGRDVLTCLNDICLPDWSIQYFRDSKTWKLDVTKWLRNNELRQRHQHHHPHQQQQHSEARTPPNWIRSIIEGNIEDFKADLQRGIGHPDDGWTPLHFAILIHQHDLVRFILETRRGDSETATHTLLPRFILDELKYRCQFEYNYVYKHTVGFTPLLLATFIGDKVAIDILGTHVTGWQLDMKDCLTLAYCEDTENNLLNIMCGIGEKHVCEKYNLNVKLHSVYEKDCPNRRILISSSNDIQRRIEEDLVPVRLILDNENIIREFLNHSKTDSSARNTPLLGRVIESHADWLWQSNSNLNAIMPGHTSSLSEEHQTDEAMVVLHCSHKGFIHTHELPFKRYLHKDGERVRVHVIQGLFRLGPLNSSSQSVHDLGREKGKIQTGYKIKYGKAPRDMMATLGMMVEDLDGNTGILTCAHTFLNDFLKSKSGPFYDRLYKQDGPLQADVFLRKPELLVSDHVDINEGEGESKARYRSDHEYMEVEAGEPQASSDPDCEMADAEQATRCGYVRRVLFQTDTDVAIDVALIMLNSDAIECCPKLYFFPRDRDDEKIQLKRVGTNFKRKDLKFATGNKFKQPVKQVELGYKVIKCGITTGLSVGALAFCDNRHQAQVKVTDDQCQVTVNSNVFILKGQIVVERTADKEFFQEGDSGSAVFVKAEDSFECLGIAIGGMTSSSETLVTPIESVLRALKEQPQGASQMQEYKLKTFF